MHIITEKTARTMKIIAAAFNAFQEILRAQPIAFINSHTAKTVKIISNIFDFPFLYF